MTFQEIPAPVIAWLRREHRVSYRALKRQLHLDDDYMARLLGYLGEAYLLDGRPEEALPLAMSALALSRDRKAQGFQAYALRLPWPGTPARWSRSRL